MIELRWLKRVGFEPVLQMRQWAYNSVFQMHDWSDWQDVPTVHERSSVEVALTYCCRCGAKGNPVCDQHGFCGNCV